MGVRRLLISNAAAPVETLGPGPAAVLWVQGCDLVCVGCMSKDTWSRNDGHSAAISDVARWLDSTGLSYLTLSGGEPMDQADELVELLDRLDPERWVVTCFTGHTLEWLRRREGPRKLLERVDLLVDGPYMERQHAPLRWRGSSNQQLHVLSDRVSVSDDRPAGLSLWVEPDGSVRLLGVPERPGFVEQFVRPTSGQLAPVGAGRPTPLPFPSLEVD